MSKCLVNKKPLLREWTSCLNKKTSPKMRFEWIGKSIRKKIRFKKLKKNRKK